MQEVCWDALGSASAGELSASVGWHFVGLVPSSLMRSSSTAHVAVFLLNFARVHFHSVEESVVLASPALQELGLQDVRIMPVHKLCQRWSRTQWDESCADTPSCHVDGSIPRESSSPQPTTLRCWTRRRVFVGLQNELVTCDSVIREGLRLHIYRADSPTSNDP